MKVVIDKIEFLNLSLGETEPTNYLSGNKGDKEQAQVFIRYQDDVLATGNTIASINAGLTVLVLNPSSLRTGEIEQPKQLWCSNELAFETFNVGDEITIFSKDTDPIDLGRPEFTITRTIVSKINDQLLLVDEAFDVAPYTGEFFLALSSVVFVSTPIESIEFKNGLIENDEGANYIDKLTGLTRRATAENLDNTDLVTEHPMIQLGDKAYQDGTLSARGNGIGLGPTDPQVSQAFVITHTFTIGPLSIAEIVDKIKSRIAAPWFIDNKCLRYAFEIEASRDLNNPNDVKIGISDSGLRGNSGDTDENLNTGIKRYSISDVTYTRPDATTTPAIELSTNEITVSFFLNNTFNNPFSDGDTRLVFNHWVLHTDPDQYRLPQFPDPANTYPARDRFMKENQLFDRIVTTLGSTSAVSDNNGGSDQIIKEITTLWLSNSKIKVTVTFAMATTAVQRISAISNLEYELSISVADHTKTRAKSDKETPVVDIQPYFIETTDATMIVPVNSILLHTGSDIDTDTVQSSTIRPGDDFNGVTFFGLNRNNVPNFPRADADIILTSVTCEMIGKKDDDFFVLDSETKNLTGSELVVIDGHTSIPEIDESKDRGFSSPVDDLRKFFTIKNRHDLDNAGVFSYEINCPFMMRWNSTQKLDGVPNDFLDPLAPANEHRGKNHNWAHYFVGTGWTMYYRVTIAAIKDGVPQVYTLDSQLQVEDSLQGAEWGSEDITAFKTDATGTPADEIVNGSQSGAMESQLTLIRGEKTYIGLDADPVLGDLEAVFLVSVFEEGNFKSAFLISTLYDLAGNNPWIGLNGILTATLTPQGGGVFRLEAILKNGFYASNQQIRVSCRFYDKRDEAPPQPPAVGILEEDGTFILEEGVSTTYGIEE